MHVEKLIKSFYSEYPRTPRTAATDGCFRKPGQFVAARLSSFLCSPYENFTSFNFFVGGLTRLFARPDTDSGI